MIVTEPRVSYFTHDAFRHTHRQKERHGTIEYMSSDDKKVEEVHTRTNTEWRYGGYRELEHRRRQMIPVIVTGRQALRTHVKRKRKKRCPNAILCMNEFAL